MTDSSSTFCKKNEYFKKRELSRPFVHPIVYNSMVVTKQIYFLTIFSKSQVYLSDNIACVVGGPQYY